MPKLLLTSCIIALSGAAAFAQPAAPPAPQKPPAPGQINPAEIRRQAAQRAEFRALLADPDADVRLLTMREAIVNGDAIQRSAAIEAGLASNETAMLELALRGVMTDTQVVTIEFLDKDGKITTEGGNANMRLLVKKFDPATGRFEGDIACGGNPAFVGQLQGAVFAFKQNENWCSGTLTWSPETGDFRGRINFNNGNPVANRNAVWKPR